MDLLDKKLDELEQRYEMPQNGGASDNDEADDETAKQDRRFDDLFWSKLISSNYKKRNRALSAVSIVTVAAILALTCYMLITMIFGEGWVKNFLDDNNANINFTLPLYDPPKSDDRYYEQDGRYTTEGAAKALSPSVVSVVVYYDISAQSLAVSNVQGSGIVFTDNGYIVTNAHVVDKSPLAVKVILYDDREFSAKIVGLDVKSDLAVLKIDAEGLSPAQFANSDSVEQGEEVVAIGSPAGLYGSITKGVVSAVGREIRPAAENIEMECIQIDAAINPGNSGGALFNMWGQVIGIISSKLSATYYDGIGFAISTNAAKPIIEEIIENGYIKSRVRIGITFYGVSQETANIYGFAAKGLYISSIDENCDIANTDLQVGDIITHINGKEVTSLTDTVSALDGKRPGDTVTAKVLRPDGDGFKDFEISFKLASDNSSDFVEKND